MHPRWLPLVLALSAEPALAQRPAGAALDSIWRAPDTATAIRLADAIAAHGADATRARIAAGLAGMRVYELTGDRDRAKQARSDAEAARREEPGDAWAHFGVGLALAHGPGVRETPKVVIGRMLAEAL
jgi:hypothetical protein